MVALNSWWSSRERSRKIIINDCDYCVLNGRRTIIRLHTKHSTTRVHRVRPVQVDFGQPAFQSTSQGACQNTCESKLFSLLQTEREVRRSSVWRETMVSRRGNLFDQSVFCVTRCSPWERPCFTPNAVPSHVPSLVLFFSATFQRNCQSCVRL